jgi:hypothetical protein
MSTYYYRMGKISYLSSSFSYVYSIFYLQNSTFSEGVLKNIIKLVTSLQIMLKPHKIMIFVFILINKS